MIFYPLRNSMLIVLGLEAIKSLLKSLGRESTEAGLLLEKIERSAMEDSRHQGRMEGR